MLQQLSLGKKVKLKLIQPAIKCSGRDDVVCYFRGKVLHKLDDSALIRFKYKGEWKEELYFFEGSWLGFYDEEIKDIKLVG